LLLSKKVCSLFQVTYDVVKEPVPVGPGPWGGDGGKPWDDGVYTGVKQIYITRSDFIGSIQIEYDRSGQSVWSAKHGNGGQIIHRVRTEAWKFPLGIEYESKKLI
jgi:hypothetical protein